jgi:hypothetical protein
MNSGQKVVSLLNILLADFKSFALYFTCVQLVHERGLLQNASKNVYVRKIII